MDEEVFEWPYELSWLNPGKNIDMWNEAEIEHIPFRSFSGCPLCGAVINDRDTHKAFHERLGF